jgi:hypothetical protein
LLADCHPEKTLVTMVKSPASGSPQKRLQWIDIAKGIGILWVVYFHFVTNYLDADVNPDMPAVNSGHFWQSIAAEHGWDSLSNAFETLARGLGWAVSLSGFHAVGLFVLLGDGRSLRPPGESRRRGRSSGASGIASAFFGSTRCIGARICCCL